MQYVNNCDENAVIHLAIYFELFEHYLSHNIINISNSTLLWKHLRALSEFTPT